MKKIVNLRDLYIQQSRELYNATEREISELPKLESQSTSQQLKAIITKQILKSMNQQVRIAEAMKDINASPEGEICLITESILEHAHNNTSRAADSAVRDAGIITSMQHLIHRKLAGFGSTCSFAREIGQEHSARTLHEALIEAWEIDNALSELAEVVINKLAKVSLEEVKQD